MVNELLKKRRSVRDFMEKTISDEIIETILEAGRLSPSGGNEQSWIFGVIKDKELISKISKISYNQDWINTAPLLIVLCTIIVDDDKGGRNIQKVRFPTLKEDIEKMDKILYSSLNMEEHQTKICGTHMALSALENGIYSTWVSYFNVEELSKLLNLPSSIIPSEILVFGYPKHNLKPTEKKLIREVSFINYYKD